VLIGEVAPGLSRVAATAAGAGFVEEPDWALGAPIGAGTDGFAEGAGLLDDEAASAGTRSQSADGPGFTSGAVASKDGLLPGFSAAGTLCSSRCASTVGPDAPPRGPAAPCAIGAMNRSAPGPLAAPANPDTQPKTNVAAMIEISRGDLALNWIPTAAHITPPIVASRSVVRR
jgi:hypothetical protein